MMHARRSRRFPFLWRRTTATPSSMTSPSFRSFAHYVFSTGRAAAVVTLLLMIFAGLTEGLSIVLLVPLLGLLDHGAGGVAAPRVHFHLPIIHTPIELGLAAVLAAFCVLTSLRAFIVYWRDVATASLTFQTVNTLRNDLFSAITEANWEFLSGRRGSELNHAMTADTDRVQIAIMQILNLLQSALLTAVYIGISLVLSTKLTLVAATIGVLALAVLKPVRRRAKLYGRSLTTQRQEQYRVVTEFLSSIKVAKSFNAEPIYAEQMRSNLADVKHALVTYVRLQGRGSLIFQIVSVLGLSLFIFLAVSRFQIPVSQIIVMLFLMMRIAPRIVGLQTSTQDLLSNMAAFETMRLLELESREALEQQVGLDAPPASFSTLRLQSVDFHYQSEKDKPVLKGLDFAIEAGSNVAIVGPSGSGKSTVADLIMGFIEPRRGAVLVDGKPLNQIDRRAWRQRIAYVPQDVVLLHDTIAANVRLGQRAASDADVWTALEVAGAKGFVEALPDKLDTVVGDRGLRLSGGERQRIALARALLRLPLLLILDEATSALDWESRTAVGTAIKAIHGKMTVINIAHRPSMVALADTVIAIRDGEVIQLGSVDRLMSDVGSYVYTMMRDESDR
jgi:ATP-binding cassette subfamily C protein